MKRSVALLLAAQAELATHDNERDVIVSNLCRTFDIGTDDALAAVVAAQLLANQPDLGEPVSPVEETSHQQRSAVTERTTCIETPHP